MKLKLLSVVGARPNFMKIAPFIHAIRDHNQGILRETGQFHNIKIEHTLVHTGQHYDATMSDTFFKTLNIPEPEINLGVGSGTHAEQVGNTMIKFEKVLKQIQPHWVVVVGDVNATLACSVTAKKEHIKCCHIEAGLRSRDLGMPEEINRLVTDRLSDLLLTPDKMSNENLRKECVPEEKIRFVGNIMIDTLRKNRVITEKLEINNIIRNNLLQESATFASLTPAGYALMTLHRPSNVDEKKILTGIVDFLIGEVQAKLPLVWTVHPRTKKQLELFNLWEKILAEKNILLLNPLGYHELLRLNMDAKILLTDSGGLQEECTILGTPCLTLRFNTERPITLREYGGVSVLVGNDIEKLHKEFVYTMKSDRKPKQPELWDGHTAPRCILAIIESSNRSLP